MATFNFKGYYSVSLLEEETNVMQGRRRSFQKDCATFDTLFGDVTADPVKNGCGYGPWTTATETKGPPDSREARSVAPHLEVQG